MEHDYQIADISEDCIAEINVLQAQLSNETEKDIILIAYQRPEVEN